MDFEKLSFEIDVEVINEDTDSKFAIVKLDFFASGENRNNYFISEETLEKTKNTILGCPLVWKYDEYFDDIYTHDIDEVPCGFIPENAEITSRRLDDGRVMLSVTAYIWKRYTGRLIEIFKRDGGEKPVSVELSVLASQKRVAEKDVEILDFTYEAVTLLGTYVRPAIPDAKAVVVSFSQLKEEYEEDFLLEFSNQEDIDNFLVMAYLDKAKDILLSKNNSKEVISMGKKLKEVEEVVEDVVVAEDFAETEDASDVVNNADVADDEKEKEEMAKSEDKDEDKEEMAKSEDDEKEEDMAEEKSEDDESEDDKEDMAEDDESDEEYALPSGINMEALTALLGEVAFSSSDELSVALFAKSVELQESNVALLAFKEKQDNADKSFEVNSFMAVLAEKYQISDEDAQRFTEESDKYSFSELNEWQTWCKVESFDFASKETNEVNVVEETNEETEDIVRLALDEQNVVSVNKQEPLWD